MIISTATTWRCVVLNDGEEKARGILKYARSFKFSYYIETGTSFGTTFAAVMGSSTGLFEIYFTIESAHDKYLNALETLSPTFVWPPHEVIHARSDEHLGRLMDHLKEQSRLPFLIFLDAHDTDVEEPTPIIEELSCIFYQSDKLEQDFKHHIVIDDARLFGTGTWPSLEEIELNVLSHEYKMFVEDDLIYLTPEA